MPFLTENQAIASLRFLTGGDSEEMVATIGVHCTAGAAATANAVAEEIRNAWVVGFPASSYSNVTTFVGVTVRFGPTEAPGPVGIFDSPLLGTGIVANLPNNCAFLVRKLTGLGGRRNKGRMYLPPIFLTESDVGTTGVIDATDVVAMQAKLDSFFADLINGPLIEDAVIFHSGGVNPLPATVITALQMQNKIATQRRRLRP